MGLGINNFLPVRVASEATQFALLTLRDNISRGTALATLGMTRIIDVWSSTVLLSAGLFVVPGAGQLARYTAGGLVISVLLVGLVHFLAWEARVSDSSKRFPLLATFSAALRELERHKLRLTVSVLASVVHWGVLGLSAWILAGSMGVEISLTQAILLTLATIFVSTSIPTVPGAIGVFEAAVVYILAFFDVDKSHAFPYALVLHALFFVPPTAMAVLLLPREGLGSLGKLGERSRALMNAPPRRAREVDADVLSHRIASIAAAIVALPFLLSCTTGEATPTPSPVPTLPATAVAPDTGRLDLAAPLTLNHWDVHLSPSHVLASWGPGIVYSRLLRFQSGPEVEMPSQATECDLCESWEQVNSTTFLFRLREGVLWQGRCARERQGACCAGRALQPAPPADAKLPQRRHSGRRSHHEG